MNKDKDNFEMNFNHDRKNSNEKYIDYNEVTLEKFLDILKENSYVAKKVVAEAVENNEFEIYLQPKLDIFDKEVCGAEALIRWNHPKFGVIGPKLFIQMMETEKIIHIIDKFSICEVLNYQKHQIDMGESVVPISCNLSAVTLSNDGIADFIFSELKERSLPEDVLIIEITETALAYDNNKIMKNINNFKNYGIKLSMDDFGTGVSSLANLANIPVDEIKIDMNMVKNAVSSSRGKIILLAVIEMAKALDLDIVVEGMETLEEVEFVNKAGCRVCQCYYFSRPLDIEGFNKYIEMGSYRK